MTNEHRLPVERYSPETEKWVEGEISISDADLARLMGREVIIEESWGQRRTITRAKHICAAWQARGP